MSRNCFGISSRVFALFDRFWFIILARNIECQSILQKTIKQFGVVASKYERKSRYKSNFQCVSLHSRICLCPVMSRDMFLQSAFQFGFYRRNPVFSPWNLAWNSFYIVENPNLLVSPFNSPPIDQSFSSILRPENCTAVSVFFFLNPAVEIMIHMLFNTLLKITPHNRQKRRKRKERIK